MSTFLLALGVVLLWILVGLVAALLFLGRRGYRSEIWYLVGAVLGPLFVPIAMERGRRATPGPEPSPDSTDETGPVTVLVGVDGSPESEQAVRATAELFDRARILLIGVADPDIEEFGDEARQVAWRELLDRAAGRFSAHTPRPVSRLLYGQPDRVLLEAAAAEHVDVLVVGRRGRGLSHRLLGSVADSLSRHATVPVLLTGPGSPEPVTPRGSHASGGGQLPAAPAQLGGQQSVGIPGDGGGVDADPADDDALDRGGGDRFPQ